MGVVVQNKVALLWFTVYCELKIRIYVKYISSVAVLEDPRGPIFKSLSLSPNYKSLSSSSEVQVLENFRGLSRLSVSALVLG